MFDIQYTSILCPIQIRCAPDRGGPCGRGRAQVLPLGQPDPRPGDTDASGEELADSWSLWDVLRSLKEFKKRAF